MISAETDQPTMDCLQTVWRLSFSIRNAYLAKPIKCLRRIGIGGGEFGEIEVMQIVCSTEELPRCLPPRRRVTCWRWPSIASRRSTLEIHSSITQRSHFNYDHFVFILVASSIGAIGLLTDSTAFVMASFFISPLMRMVLAVAWGVTIYDWQLVKRGLRNILFGVSLSLLAGGSTALCLAACDSDGLCQAGFQAQATQPQPQADWFVKHRLVATVNIDSLTILAQNSFWPTSPFVAALSGIAVALGESGGIPSALSGVALSSSLLLPIVNAGMMLVLAAIYPASHNSHGQPIIEVALHSLLHYLIDVVFILTFAVATFKMKHVSGKSLRPIASRDRLRSSHCDGPLQYREFGDSINGSSSPQCPNEALRPSTPSTQRPLLRKALSFSAPTRWPFDGMSGAKADMPSAAMDNTSPADEENGAAEAFNGDIEYTSDDDEVTLIEPQPFRPSAGQELSFLSSPAAARHSHSRTPGLLCNET
jgi:uncharacterized membrane protein